MEFPERNKMSEMFEKIKVYNIVLGALRSSSEGPCVSCICTENVFVRLKKRLKKLKHDLESGKEKNSELFSRVDKMLELAEKLPIKAKDPECLMTKGICKLPKCIMNPISEILTLVKP